MSIYVYIVRQRAIWFSGAFFETCALPLYFRSVKQLYTIKLTSSTQFPKSVLLSRLMAIFFFFFRFVYLRYHSNCFLVTHSSHMIILGSTWTKLHPPSFGASSACTVKVSCRLQLLQDGCTGPAAATFVAYWGRNIPPFQRRQRLCVFRVFQVGWMAMQFVEMHRSYRTCTS